MMWVVGYGELCPVLFWIVGMCLILQSLLSLILVASIIVTSIDVQYIGVIFKHWRHLPPSV